MRTHAGDGWTVVVLPLGLFLSAFLADGVDLAVLAASLGFLVIGPAYLLSRRRRRGEPERPKDDAAEARAAGRWLRALVGYNLVACLCVLVLAFARPAGWLGGSAWTVALLVFAGQGISSTLYIWAVADVGATGRTKRRALAVSGLVEVVVGATCAIVAIGNQVDGWLGGTAWTIALTALAAFAVFSAVTCLRRLKA